MKLVQSCQTNISSCVVITDLLNSAFSVGLYHGSCAFCVGVFISGTLFPLPVGIVRFSTMHIAYPISPYLQFPRGLRHRHASGARDRKTPRRDGQNGGGATRRRGTPALSRRQVRPRGGPVPVAHDVRADVPFGGHLASRYGGVEGRKERGTDSAEGGREGGRERAREEIHVVALAACTRLSNIRRRCSK